ncbi:hypothetical protein GUD57_003204 [Salmonella enterica]|nr:hypothetical protein [Salmonella enterica]EJC0928394.1 hypothetical protein [Salmonella enterica]
MKVITNITAAISIQQGYSNVTCINENTSRLLSIQPMSSVGTDLPVGLGLAMYNKICQGKSDLMYFIYCVDTNYQQARKVNCSYYQRAPAGACNTYLFQGFNDPYFFD